MEYYSEDYFKRTAGRLELFEQRTFSAGVRHAPLTTVFDVFLSYNINDKEVVEGIFYVLSKKGLKVYLDSIVDADLHRSETDKQTAERLHTRLKKSRSLLYAQSQSAAKSNWMPWELGIVDGSDRPCMIMPVTKNTPIVSSQREYLSLYPVVRPDRWNEGLMKIYGGGTRIADSTNYVDYIRNVR